MSIVHAGQEIGPAEWAGPGWEAVWSETSLVSKNDRILLPIDLETDAKCVEIVAKLNAR